MAQFVGFWRVSDLIEFVCKELFGVLAEGFRHEREGRELGLQSVELATLIEHDAQLCDGITKRLHFVLGQVPTMGEIIEQGGWDDTSEFDERAQELPVVAEVAAACPLHQDSNQLLRCFDTQQRGI